MSQPYTMHIEKPAFVIKQHGFNLGTDRLIAESFVMERLQNDPSVVSIALRRGGKLVRTFDFRDIEPAWNAMQDQVDLDRCSVCDRLPHEPCPSCD